MHFKYYKPTSDPTMRIPVTLDVDKYMNLVSQTEGVPEQNPLHRPATANVQAESPIPTNILPFFSPTTQCWFPGCDELRKRYEDELSAASKSGGCPACVRGALIRKYAKLAQDVLLAGNKQS